MFVKNTYFPIQGLRSNPLALKSHEKLGLCEVDFSIVRYLIFSPKSYTFYSDTIRFDIRSREFVYSIFAML